MSDQLFNEVKSTILNFSGDDNISVSKRRDFRNSLAKKIKDMGVSYAKAVDLSNGRTELESVHEYSALFYERAIVVGGCMKSGTTFTRNLFESNPNLVVPPSDLRLTNKTFSRDSNEEYFAHCLNRWLRRLIIPMSLKEPFFVLGECADIYKKFVTVFTLASLRYEHSLEFSGFIAFCSVMNINPRNYDGWVSVTAGDDMRYDEIQGVFEQPYFVFLSRDPLSNYCSHEGFVGNYLMHKMDYEWAGIMSAIRSSHQNINNCLSNKRTEHVRYEDLVINTNETIYTLLDKFDMDRVDVKYRPIYFGQKVIANSSLAERRVFSIENKSVYWSKKSISLFKRLVLQAKCFHESRKLGYMQDYSYFLQPVSILANLIEKVERRMLRPKSG